MSSHPAPEVPLYRITLFYGPERVDGQPSSLHCVFNVKKRSWKGGVQVAVELDEAQVARAGEATELEAWLRSVLASVAAEERNDYVGRARDLFVEGLCRVKLELALGGLQQDNATLGSEMMAGELEQAVRAQADRIKAQILTELDLPHNSAER